VIRWGKILQDILEKFNLFFNGLAKDIINDNQLEITIDNRTMTMLLPTVIVGQSHSKD